ncbi:hypothetical protein LCGC14_2854380, partial [marine sediment metagenome]
MIVNVNSPGYVVGFAAAVSALFTAAIMTLYAAAEPAVLRNEKLFQQKALIELFGLDGGRKLPDDDIVDLYGRHVRLGPKVTDPVSGSRFELVRAVERDARTGAERIVAYAMPIWGVGFWARIEGYLALSPGLDEVVGIAFLKHAETPGLGGRITEKKWRRQFAGLPLTRDAEGGKFITVG